MMTSTEIYIKVNDTTDISTNLINDFKTRVLADSGTFEAGNCLLDSFENLGGYIGTAGVFKRIDLFKDEKISLTSSVQNINDLSKVFTDYTQSFTIPATKNNNLIFNYWNENGVNDGFDHRIRYDALIELNTMPFKTGKIQIEKANEKNNRIESYSITFYGDVKQIKDLFKEDKLSQLDYTTLNHPYTYAQVRDRIYGAIDTGVYYPLVGNQHKYEYLTGGTNDITLGGSIDESIVYTDLFPAIPVSKVFDFISTKYGINFTGVFFTTSYWTDLYLYCKNIEQQQNVYSPEVYLLSYFLSGSYNYTGIALNTIPSSVLIPYRIVVKDSSGLIVNVIDNILGNQSITLYSQTDTGGGEYLIYTQTLGGIDLDVSLDVTITYYDEQSSSYMQENINTSNSISTTSDINIASMVPDMKVIDFFNGIIKLFNLTITATNENTFNIEPLEFFYSYGKYTDINNFVITDNTDIERPKLFKKLSFGHEKSESILNNYFRNTFNRGYDYGDLLFEDNLSNESSTYEIKSPFEDVMWERATDENFQTSTLIDKDLKPYKPKPILMYKNGLETLSTPFKLFDGTNYNDISTYQRFSNELFINSDIASLNFGEEQSSWSLNALASLSLFNNWYRNYISALYNIRCRIVKLKAIFPITKLVDIKLNDKLIYKDKKYIINQFTTDLTTGEVDLELMTDFREVTLSENGIGRFALKQVFNIDNTAQDLEVTLLKLNSDSYDINYYATSYQSLGNTQDDTFIIPIDANTTGDVAFKQIELTYYNPDVKQYINIIQNA